MFFQRHLGLSGASAPAVSRDPTAPGSTSPPLPYRDHAPLNTILSSLGGHALAHSGGGGGGGGEGLSRRLVRNADKLNRSLDEDDGDVPPPRRANSGGGLDFNQVVRNLAALHQQQQQMEGSPKRRASIYDHPPPMLPGQGAGGSYVRGGGGVGPARDANGGRVDESLERAAKIHRHGTGT